jgi:hypothetical protein
LFGMLIEYAFGESFPLARDVRRVIDQLIHR